MLTSLFVGALSGWIAGKIMDSRGGLLHNIILGIVGGFVGSLLLGLIGIGSYSMMGDILVSVIGACVFILLGRRFF